MGLDKSQIAWRAAQDLKNGAVVILGLGTPVLVSNFVESSRDIFFQSENGILGVGPEATQKAANPDLVDAGSRKVTLIPGASIFDSSWMSQFLELSKSALVEIQLIGTLVLLTKPPLSEAQWT